MALDPVPWMMGGGAQHSPESGRNTLHIATERTQGIVGTPDFFVSPYPTPGTGVRVAVGSGLIWKDGTPSTQETYGVRAMTSTNVSVAPTGSGSGRSDLVVIRVEDPFNIGAPWQTPANLASGPYVFVRVIPGVPAGTTTMAQAGRGGDSAIVLARIDLPPSTGTVQAQHITDLRKMARPRQEQFSNFNQNSTPASSLTSEVFTPWPAYAPGNVIPEWATHAQIRCWISGFKTAGPADGSMRLELWAPNNQNIIYGPVQDYDIDVPIAQWGTQPANTTGGGAVRFGMTLAGYGPVHQWRNQLAYFVLAGMKKPNRPDRAPIQVDGNTSILYDITFYERPI